ncbi:MerR family transcriptional regulator [Alteromonas oceanisediminis]|uniref:MerR family transcriptional regulator n=1 Tax=Alteromonas oceanisediminis TaxID=2836180 RepID=UPI001BDAF594|nr:MerR family transcriptional regulator [Alteromonas oceanisediminis]MBT0585255.1 MerR family transcriptional regulator [Alteromonas oceanisediminis]
MKLLHSQWANMKISVFEKKVGLSRDTIRYYEKIGMLTPPRRSANGYRVYSHVQMDELAFIQKGKSIGFSLDDIKQGYNRYKQLGALCPQFIAQLERKKLYFKQRIDNDTRAIRDIESLLKQPES